MALDTASKKEEVEILNKVYSLIKAKASTLGIPEKILAKYYRGAKDVLKRIQNIEYREGYVKATILSTKASRLAPEHTVVVRDLTGKLRKVTVGVPIEESYHHVIVAEHMMKCDCPVALRNASKADNWLEKFVKKNRIRYNPSEMLFAKHVLCKHTLAVLAKGIGYGAVPLTDRLIDNITVSLVGLAIAEGAVNENIEKELIRILRRLSRRR